MEKEILKQIELLEEKLIKVIFTSVSIVNQLDEIRAELRKLKEQNLI